MASVLTPDLCVIGAGAGGLAVAAEARALGASVVVVERDRIGGNRLNTGAVPSRAFAAAAARAHAVRTSAAFGVAADEPKINFGRIHDHVQQVIAGMAPEDSVERLAAIGVEVIKAQAKFVDRQTLKGGDRLIKARRFVLATGATPLLPAIPGLDGVQYFTHETIFENTRKPGHLIVVGGGPTGLELAQAHRRLGSEVTVIEAADVLPGFDPELAVVVLRRLREEGVDIRTATEVVSVAPKGTGVAVTIRGDEEPVAGTSLLVAVGRTPMLDGLDLEKAGIRRVRKGEPELRIKHLRTTNPNVYAIGDAAAGSGSGGNFAHRAAHEARLVVRHALLGSVLRSDPEDVPRTVFTDPEIAEVGLTEPLAAAKLKGRARILRWSLAESDKARAMRETYGLAKVITDGRGKLLGAGVVGPGAGELIGLFSLAIDRGLTIGQLGRVAAPYPSFAEAAAKLAAEFRREAPPDPWLARRMAIRRLLP